MFTIEVEKKDKDNKFDFMSLKMFHQECMGGEIERSFIYIGKTLHFECKKCGVKRSIGLTDGLRIKIINIAINGGSEEVETKRESKEKIIITQKKE